MPKTRFSTIKALVFGTIHRTEGCISYKKLEGLVLKHFPESAFNKSHWVWYRYQCTKGRYASQFNKLEKENLSASLRPKTPSKAKTRSGRESPKTPVAKTLRVTNEIVAKVEKLVKAARAYEKTIGDTRKAGITAEVGEISACYHLKLRLCADSKAKGFDAIDRLGRRIQIKTRRSETEGMPRDAGRLSSFSKHSCDYVILVLLYHTYQLAEMWRADYGDLVPLIEKRKGRNPNLSSFKKIAKRVWPSS